MPGDLTTIVGPMGSGKTRQLVTYVSKYEQRGYQYYLFKNRIDNREAENICTARSGDSLPARSITLPSEIDLDVFRDGENKILAFEEIQFFDPEFVPFIKQVLKTMNVKVVVTGLNLDFRGEPFGIMPEIMALSDELIHLTGVCDVCHAPATKTQRLQNGKPVKGRNLPIVVVGGDDRYTSRCTLHFDPPY